METDRFAKARTIFISVLFKNYMLNADTNIKVALSSNFELQQHLEEVMFW